MWIRFTKLSVAWIKQIWKFPSLNGGSFFVSKVYARFYMIKLVFFAVIIDCIQNELKNKWNSSQINGIIF